MKLPTLLLLAAAAALPCFAADVTGKWTAQVPGRDGAAQETTFAFKQDGEKLSGSVTSPRGERAISDGKVTGDSLSFSIETQRGKQTFTGTISGGEIKFKREGGQGQPREFTAKKAQS